MHVTPPNQQPPPQPANIILVSSRVTVDQRSDFLKGIRCGLFSQFSSLRYGDLHHRHSRIVRYVSLRGEGPRGFVNPSTVVGLLSRRAFEGSSPDRLLSTHTSHTFHPHDVTSSASTRVPSWPVHMLGISLERPGHRVRLRFPCQPLPPPPLPPLNACRPTRPLLHRPQPSPEPPSCFSAAKHRYRGVV